MSAFSWRSSTTPLLIENEFYGTIRPKRVIFHGEPPLHELRGHGAMYREALKSAVTALHDAATLPSARVLDTMAKRFDNSYTRFIQAQSQQTRDALLHLPFPTDLEARFTELAQASIEEQKSVEAADTMPFEIYRQKYLSTERLGIRKSSTPGA